MPVIRFDSVKEFMDDLPDSYSAISTDWAGGLDYSECRRAVWEGDKTALKYSDDLLTKVEGEGMELLSPQWENERTGAIPCVPSFIAGAPDSMRRLENSRSDVAPIKIYLDLFISAGFKVKECSTRGAAILALARKLESLRPVELYLLMSCGDSRYNSKTFADGWLSPMIKIDTNPLDLTTASFVLGHPGFIRQLAFAWCIKHGADDCIPYFKEARDKIKPDDADLFVENAILNRDMLADPVDWVNQQVKRYTRSLDDLE